MLQLFFKKSDISANEWSIAYEKIEAIVDAFPSQLLRLESYDGFSRELDKLHFELYVEKGSLNEHISFFTDWISFSGGKNVKFYKNWEQHILTLEGNEIDESKAITWTPYIPFKNDGSLPTANGCTIKSYFDFEGAMVEYVFLTIAIMLENLLPNKVFLIALYQNTPDIMRVIQWLEGHFKEDFGCPIYFDKPRLLEDLMEACEDKKEIVCRMEHLYRKQYKQNMQFAIANIGYEPSLAFYAEVLADSRFGTFGFSDVLDAWMAATEDLESALQLIAASKLALLNDTTNANNTEKIAAYDLTYILKKLLDNYVFWTLRQREELAHFYTNKEALETGKEDLWGSIFRMTGNRIDICPVMATENELFEAFMYHDPKNGLLYKQTIEAWITKNKNAFDHIKVKLAQAESEAVQNEPNNDEDESEPLENLILAENFINAYKNHEQFFIEKALTKNPTYTQIDEAIEQVRTTLGNMNNNPKQQAFVSEVIALSKEEKINNIKYRVKELRMGLSVHNQFEHWLMAEEDNDVLSYIYFLLAWKIYNKRQAYARFRILWDKELWDYWRRAAF